MSGTVTKGGKAFKGKQFTGIYTRDTKGPENRAFLRADEGTRTLDLLHGKQTL